MAITNEMKQRMLERLDTTKVTIGVGLISVILLKRNAAGIDDEQYIAGGGYGGVEAIAWNATVTDTLEQDTAITFNVEQGVYIEGYEILFDDSVNNDIIGALVDTDTYIFDEDGTFTITNINITVG
ncbi:MAG: hypothetical protein PF440_02420 [Thiomicrorhabdus sp.]|jgi:hypothetical protein|nr:hypothetical protein [Thiomicrorhabdus sp.]